MASTSKSLYALAKEVENKLQCSARKAVRIARRMQNKQMAEENPVMGDLFAMIQAQIRKDRS